MYHNERLYFSPNKDYKNPSIVGNLIFKEPHLNNVNSIPVFDKDFDVQSFESKGVFYGDYTDDNMNSYKTILTMDEDNIDGLDHFVDLNRFLLKDTKNAGYEKLVYAIENNEIVDFSISDFDTLGGFYTQLEMYTDFTRVLPYVQPLDYLEINETDIDMFEMIEKNTTYITRYSKNDEHIYINDFPVLHVEDFNIKVLNETDILNQYYKNMRYSDYLTTGNDTFFEIDLKQYMNKDNKFVENLVKDISPIELIKDNFKQRTINAAEVAKVSYYKSLINDSNNEAKIKNMTDSKVINSITKEYQNNINYLVNSRGNDLTFENVEYVGNFNRDIDCFMYINNSLDSISHSIYEVENFLLVRDDLRDCTVFVDEAIEELFSIRDYHSGLMNEFYREDSLINLDRLKVESLEGNISKDFYEGFRFNVYISHLIPESEIIKKEHKLEIVNDFKNLYESSSPNNIAKFDFFNDKLILNNKAYDYEFFSPENSKEINSLLEDNKSIVKDTEMDL